MKWLVSGTRTLKLKAAIPLSCPFIWPQYVINSKVGESVKGYYGDERKVEENASCVLLLVPSAASTGQCFKG